MGAPKPKPVTTIRSPLPRPTRPTPAELEAAEDRADIEAAERAQAEWEATGRPAPIPWEQVKADLDRLK